MAKTKPDDDEDEVLLDAPPDAATDEAAASLAPAEDAARATEGAEAVEERKPLWQELDLDEAYKDVEDPVEIARRLAAERKAAEQAFNDRLANEQRSWQEQTQNWLTQRKWREEQAAKEAASKAPAEKPKWWNPPVQYNAEWSQYIKVNPETGETEIVAPTEQIKNDILNYARYKREHDERWNNDREGYLREFVQQVVPELMQQQLSTYMAEQQEAQQLGRLELESASWLYQHDGDPNDGGQLIRDPDGNLFLTPVGIQVMDYARRLHQRGLGSQSECFVAARDAIMGRHLLNDRLAAENASKAKKNSDSRKLDALDANGTRRKNRNGAEAKAETRNAPAQSNSSRALFTAMFDSLSSPDGTFDPLAV